MKNNLNRMILKMNKDIIMNEEMITTDKEIIDTLNIPFQPIDGRVLIKPLSPVILQKEVTEIDREATMKARAEAGDNVEDVEPIFKTEIKEVESNLRIGVVLAIGGEEGKTIKPPYEIGDKVVYIHAAAMPFELFKDTVLLQRYDVKGKWLS